MRRAIANATNYTLRTTWTWNWASFETIFVLFALLHFQTLTLISMGGEREEAGLKLFHLFSMLFLPLMLLSGKLPRPAKSVAIFLRSSSSIR